MIRASHHMIAVCALATAACSGSTTGAPGGQVAGAGGANPPVGGYGGRRPMGPYMGGSTGTSVGGSASGGTGPVAAGMGGTGGSTCGGPAPPSGGGSSSPTRSVGVECYVSDLVEGEPACLPANMVSAQQLSDHIQSTGFVVEYVIDFQESIALPESCEPLVACCGAREPGYMQQQCFDWLDSPRAGVVVDGCPVQSSNFREYFGCAQGDGGAPGMEGESGAAGAPAGPSRALCCYQTCRYYHAI